MFFREIEKENEKTFLVLKIIAFELETTNSHNHESILVIDSEYVTEHT